MESKGTSKSSPWHKESLVGLVAALGSLITAGIVFGGLEKSTWLTLGVLTGSLSIILALVAALTKISSIQISLDKFTLEYKKKKKK